MNPNELKAVWQSQTAPRRLTIDADVLLQQLQRNKKSFETMVFWRDFREVGVALLLVPVWFWIGSTENEMPWTWYLCVPAMLWVAGFMVVDRIRQRRRQPRLGDPLRECVEHSLAEVEHQIWLLRNVFWWYLLPPGAAIAAFFAHVAWMARDGGWLVGLIMAGVVTVAGLILWGVFWINQVAVRDELEPRRRELQALIANLDDTNHTGGIPGQVAGGTRPSASSKWSTVFQVFLTCLVVATFAWIIYDLGIRGHRNEPKMAVPDFRPASGDTDGFQVLSARYGGEGKWVDVTRELRTRVHNNELVIHAGNEIAGDPAFGVSKVLRVKYRFKGAEHQIECAEGQMLHLPEPFEVAVEKDKLMQFAAPDICPAAGDTAVTNLLVAIQQKHNVPAICAVVVTSKGVTDIGVAGVRKRGTDVSAKLDDLWHLGSDTKAMTATLVAKLVEQGRLKWDTTIAEVFPDLADKFHPDMRGVTMLQLLSHRSGLRPNLNLGRFLGDDVKQLRLRAVREELAKAPKHKPSTHYEYSNLGYIIVGAIIERVTGKSWEDAIREEVFAPLKMTSTGFGGTGTRGQIDQPWPHDSDGKSMPENGPAMDNPPVMGPAGRVHCSIQDWAKFIQDQLCGARGEPALLTPASYQKLHTPPFGGEYALGWLVIEREWGDGTVLNHGGDNTMNCANVWVAPKRDFAILVCINQSGDTAFRSSDEAVGALIKLHQGKAE